MQSLCEACHRMREVITPKGSRFLLCELSKTSSEELLTGTEIIDVPYPTDHSLRNAMRLVPNVVTDSAGDIHINGGAITFSSRRHSD